LLNYYYYCYCPIFVPLPEGVSYVPRSAHIVMFDHLMMNGYLIPKTLNKIII